jgi:uncharacterized protein YkwD
MATNGYFSHYSPDGSSVFTLLARAGYPYGIAGENIARNNYADSQSVSVAMSGFMSSPTHRSNLLSASYRYVGVGMALGANGLKYYAVVFAG